MKEYFITGVSPEEIQKLADLATEEMGPGEAFDKKTDGEAGVGWIWQIDDPMNEVSVTAYHDEQIISASQIDPASKLGQALELLSLQYPTA